MLTMYMRQQTSTLYLTFHHQMKLRTHLDQSRYMLPHKKPTEPLRTSYETILQLLIDPKSM